MLAILAVYPVWAQNTVTMSGRITDVATGLPVEGASIALVQGGSLATRRMEYADAGGNYSFDSVASGACSVEIGATGFLPYQKTNPDEVSIQVAGDHAQFNFKLTPAASITGRIGGEGADEPGRNVVVTLFREDFTDGVRHFVAGSAATTAFSSVKQDGSFEFNGLEPGRYIVGAGPRPDTRVVMSVITGKVSQEEHPAEGYVQTYYPGTTEFDAALLISVAAGETRTADFNVAKRPFFRASGEVNTSETEPWLGSLAITSTGNGPIQRTYSGSASVPGSFVVEGLPAGQYAATGITVASPAIPNPEGSGFSFSMRRMPVSLSFAITDHNVEGLRINREPESLGQLQVAGTFRMANAGTALPAGLSVQYSYANPGGESDAIPAAPTGEFWLGGAPGEYSVQPVVPAGYAVTEVLYGGANYLNSLIPMKGDTQDTSLTIVLSNQPGSVAGSIVDSEQKPVAAKIALLPDPLPANVDFRAIRVAKNDSQGAFSIGGLAPGRYKAVALTGDDRKQDHDMTLLGPKLGRADSFEVTAGQSVSVALRP